EVLFKHIKMLWDIREKHSLPAPPTKEILVEFYQKFSTAEQINAALQDSGGVQLNSEADVQAFASKKLHPVHLGQEESLQAKRHPDKKFSDKKFNELYRDEVLKVFEISDEEDFAVEGEEDEENNDRIDLEAPSEGDDDEEEGFFAPGEYQYKDDEYILGEESSKEDDESEADVSSVGNTQSYSMEVVED
ncbi:hypothetical protein O181_118183, partial [Austropuccinia psidii MF-1]|nr:hypothetical protein [Austropuccinia psidii MF-1]